MAFHPSIQHTAIFQWVSDNAYDGKRKDIRALIIDAVAGAGKTTTLREICQRIPTRESFGGVATDILYLAFNKSAVIDVTERGLAAHVEAKTLNGLGYGAVRKHNRNAKTEATKTADMLKDNLDEIDARTYSACVTKLVGIAKSQGIAPAGVVAPGAILEDSPDVWADLVDYYEVSAPGDDDRKMPRAIDLARKVLRASLTNTDVVDFDDQLYVPQMLELAMPKRYRYVFVDEAQDLNPVQRRLLRSVVSPGGVLIAVGDPHQAIYGFRGADNASIEQIGKEYGAITLPLSVTWRCPRAVVALAQRLVPHIQAAPNAPEGVVETKAVAAVTDWQAADLVVCRLNAPLVSLAYSLMRKKIPVRVAGRDFGTGLAKLIKRLAPDNLIDLLTKLTAYASKERAKLSAKNKAHLIAALDDKVETLNVLADEVETLSALTATIESLFSDNDKAKAVTLSSIHRAKGAEAKRVFLLDPSLLPFKAAKLPWELQQEKNLHYVALTRAGECLVMLIPEPKKRRRNAQANGLPEAASP